jgi:competence protein ComEA
MPQSTQGIIIMFKKLLLAVTLFVVAHAGFAASATTPSVDVNKADRPALESIKGIGPAAAESILGERSKKGSFKDWSDFESRVKGVGDARAIKLSDAGLTVNGAARPVGAVAKHAESKKGESKKGESKKAADETVSLKK